ncbi:hypothetical protein [Bifidobacterium santillanense]|uniref:hypothetical protein n=1 Tax=Bifidobacterium santillanense TaxID=2809028 RepID=UPI0030B847A9
MLWSFVVFVMAAAGQTSLIVWLPRMPSEGTQWYLAVVILLYWLVLAVVFAALIGRQIRDRLERPMRTLGEAAERVARGDFSVYVTPRHAEGDARRDATDRMFDHAMSRTARPCTPTPASSTSRGRTSSATRSNTRSPAGT